MGLELGIGVRFGIEVNSIDTPVLLMDPQGRSAIAALKLRGRVRVRV